LHPERRDHDDVHELPARSDGYTDSGHDGHRNANPDLHRFTAAQHDAGQRGLLCPSFLPVHEYQRGRRALRMGRDVHGSDRLHGRHDVPPAAGSARKSGSVSRVVG
jgi:hypothetical protein